MSYVFSQAVNALQLGSIYALVALGYSMVYGIILLLNFAHGDIIMVGAYVTYYAMTSFHLHPLVSVVLAVVMCTLLGVVIEKVAYTPLRSAPRLSLLITAIGVSFLLENGAQLIFGTDTKSMVQEPLISGSITLGGVSITYAALITIVVSVVSMIALTILVQKTKLGKAMRAVSEDMGAAQLMGIKLEKTYCFTFVLGIAMTGIAACVLVPIYSVYPTVGSTLMLPAFVVVVIGGLSSIPGALIAGLLVGVVESLSAYFLGSSYQQLAYFVLFILVILLKPEGILARRKKGV